MHRLSQTSIHLSLIYQILFLTRGRRRELSGNLSAENCAALTYTGIRPSYFGVSLFPTHSALLVWIISHRHRTKKSKTLYLQDAILGSARRQQCFNYRAGVIGEFFLSGNVLVPEPKRRHCVRFSPASQRKRDLRCIYARSCWRHAWSDAVTDFLRAVQMANQRSP